MRRIFAIHRMAGWAVFAVSLTVYLLTLEPAASLWDSGEFIAAASRLQIPHPPGAPMYLLTGRLFSLLAGSNPLNVAFWINVLSGLSSAMTIMFLYWTIVMLGRKIMEKAGPEKTGQEIMLFIAGITGSLSFAFSDSFWFSAAEAEVYAMSSMLTAIVFWAILKWEQKAEQPGSDQWLILIFFVTGISIGVHLLNLLTIPALTLVFYFKRFKPSLKGIFISLFSGFALILLVMEGFIIGLPTMAGKLEILFVNGMNLPFGSGILVFTVSAVSLLIYGLIRSRRKGQRLLNTSLICLSFLLIGYASYGIIIIRSAKNPLMDQNNPENILSFIYYLKRDQYLKPPLLYGPGFTAEIADQKQGKPRYRKGEEKYEISSYSIENIYNPEGLMLFPRMWHRDHADVYREIAGMKSGESPGFAENLYFLFAHQIGHMYVRYFLWNFAGKQSDETGAGWLTPLDHFTSKPDFIKRNPGHNNFLMVPLLLGLIGFFHTFRKVRDTWFVILLLFLMTGVAIVIYLNAWPIEPRERDYAYVGSYYAFSIWIGLGIPVLFRRFMTLTKNHKTLALAAVSVAGLSSPALMISEGWDDHDRSGRYYTVDMARNMLESCPENAVLFTGGDNDTFPLWYAQMVENFRTDVRVIVTSYFNSEWYTEQMTRRSLDSDPLPIRIPMKYLSDGGPNDYLPLIRNQNINAPVNLASYLELVRENHPAIQATGTWGTVNTLPFDQFFLDVGQNVSTGIPLKFRQYQAERIRIPLRADYILKSDLLILDLIDSANWERPLCFSYTALKNANITLDHLVIQRGLVYQLCPVMPGDKLTSRIDTATSCELMMDRMSFRGLDDPDVYYNENYRQYLMNLRNHFNALARALLEEGSPNKALQVLDASLDTMPDDSLAYDHTSLDTVRIYLSIEKKHPKALEIADIMGRRLDDELTWLIRHKSRHNFDRIRMHLSYLQGMIRVLRDAGYPEKAASYESNFMKHYRQMTRG